MSEITSQTVYFKTPGLENTQRVLALARARAEALNIKTALVATTSGAAAIEAAKILAGFDVVAVTHSYGFKEHDVAELTPENCAALNDLGVRILTCQHAFGGVGRAVRKRLDTYQIDEIIAYTLRIFGQGMKVVAEIALMAADAGLVSTTDPVVAIAGTGHGADTAVILRPTNAQTFFDLKILEIICMPSPAHPAFEP